MTLYPACVMPCFLLLAYLNYYVVGLYSLKRKANITATDIVLVLMILDIRSLLNDDSMLLTVFARLSWIIFFHIYDKSSIYADANITLTAVTP